MSFIDLVFRCAECNSEISAFVSFPKTLSGAHSDRVLISVQLCLDCLDSYTSAERDEGHQAGFEEGKEEGHQKGYEKGYDVGLEEGLSEIPVKAEQGNGVSQQELEEAIRGALEEGREEGYAEGLAEGRRLKREG